MPYNAEINRSNPSCFLFLVDQSDSMSRPFGGKPGKSKAEGVADAINRLLHNLVLKCTKSEVVRDYFHVGVLGYGGKVKGGFGGELTGQTLIPISEVARKPLRVEERCRKVDNGAGGIMEELIKFPVWFEPRARGKTPMCHALCDAREAIGQFLAKSPRCYPPVVINITDGAATDGSPEPFSTALKELASEDGNVLLFNARLSSRPIPPIEFPDSDNNLPGDYARILYRMSTVLPIRMQAAARSEGIRANDATRGFVFNADLVAFIRFLDIGTRIAGPPIRLPAIWSPRAEIDEAAFADAPDDTVRDQAIRYVPGVEPPERAVRSQPPSRSSRGP
jgi:hypothetical protein